MTETQKIFILNLKKYRKERGLSQMKLAELCGVSTSYIGEIEIGRKYPSVKTFESIADVLGVKPYKLLMSPDEVVDLNRNDTIRRFSEIVKRSLSESVDALAAKYGAGS